MIINPGMGGYWEVLIEIGKERQTLRSYKLENLIEEIIETLRQYGRDNS
jgi:hypothetical protein